MGDLGAGLAIALNHHHLRYPQELDFHLPRLSEDLGSVWEMDSVLVTSGACWPSSRMRMSASWACCKARLRWLPLLLQTKPVVATRAIEAALVDASTLS